ncbi:MAG: LCP family protein [Christensenellaceae bacterium]|jgi:LCP family protein required for cell wall assembly
MAERLAPVDAQGKKQGQQTVRRNTPPKKSKYKTWIRVLAITMGVLLIAVVGAVVWAYKMYNDIGKDPLSVFKKGSGNHTVIATDDTEHTSQGIVNVLLLGIDSDEERVKNRAGYRSDVMIVCSLDMEHGSMSMVTIPRDAYVEVDHISGKTGQVTTTEMDKITHAYAYGGESREQRAQNAVNCVERFLSCGGKFDFKIDHYASIDMGSFPKLADAVGGVEVVLPHSFDGYSTGDTYVVTSKNADDFACNRKEGGHGDDGRNERQQLFLISFVKKVQKMGAVSAVTNLYDEVIKYMYTDMNLEQVIGLFHYSKTLDVDTGIQRYRMQGNGKYIGEIWYDIIPEDEVYNTVLKYFYKPKS